jgi:hypothetical protein
MSYKKLLEEIANSLLMASVLFALACFSFIAFKTIAVEPFSTMNLFNLIKALFFGLSTLVTVVAGFFFVFIAYDWYQQLIQENSSLKVIGAWILFCAIGLITILMIYGIYHISPKFITNYIL